MNEQTSLRILLVDDDPEDAEIFRRYAAESELYRIEVDHTRGADEALRQLSEHKYNLVFLDQRLGEAVTGLDILRRIRAKESEPPIIVFTGTGNEQVAVEMMKSGATDYLLKDTFNCEILERSIHYALGQHRWATERKRAEEALRESERKYRYLFENLSVAAFLADVETGRIVEANRQAEVLLGRPLDEIIGLHQSELHPTAQAEEYRQKFANHVQRGHAADFDGEVIRKDGTIVPIAISAHVYTVGGKRVILGLFHDLGELRRLEALEREAEKLRATRDLAAGVAHNFNNLLTAIMGYAGFVRQALEELHGPLQDVEKLIECTERTARLSADLRTWVEPTAVVGQPVTLDAIVTKLVSRCRQVLPENVELITKIAAADTCLKVAVDGLLKALFNICENALEAMPEGGTLTISADTVRRKGHEGEAESAEIVIADTGRGISEEVLPKIFAPFFSTKGTVGVGLSLTLTRQTIEDEGGTIEVQSTPGQGTRCRVSLPIARG